MTLQSDIVTELNNLNAAKQAIKDALIAKGVAVSDSDTLLSYATKIGDIQMSNSTGINNGANGYYTNEDGHILIYYKGVLPNQSHSYTSSTYSTVYMYVWEIQLPVTLSSTLSSVVSVRANLNNNNVSIGSSSAYNVSDRDIIGCYISGDKLYVRGASTGSYTVGGEFIAILVGEIAS